MVANVVTEWRSDPGLIHACIVVVPTEVFELELDVASGEEEVNALLEVSGEVFSDMAEDDVERVVEADKVLPDGVVVVNLLHDGHAVGGVSAALLWCLRLLVVLCDGGPQVAEVGELWDAFVGRKGIRCSSDEILLCLAPGAVPHEVEMDWLPQHLSITHTI